MARGASFDIAAFVPQNVRLIGEGLWSRVYDLGDGTVLKLARERCAGIGSGFRKIEDEHAALTLLSASKELDGIVPSPRGHGIVPPSSPLASEGFGAWLRSTHLSGRQYSPAEVEALSEPAQSAMGREIGRALARLHWALGNAPTDAARILSPVEGRAAYAEIEDAARRIGDPFYLDAIAALVRARARIPRSALARQAHGDFNISNLLFDPAGQVCGIVDFAEWGPDFPEKDLSDIVNELPRLAPSLLAAYEQAGGWRPDPFRLTLGIAENALYGAVIGERAGDAESVRWGRGLLAGQLEALAL